MLIGHSGAKLKLIETDVGFYVEKSGSERLCKQAQKQSQFLNLIQTNPILNLLFEVPTISNQTPQSFVMNFYNGKSILDIFEKNDISSLNSILDKLFFFIDWELSLSKQQKFPYDLFVDKITSIRSQVQINSSLFEEYLYILQTIKKVWIPIGVCHGDLTFSNLIFTDKIVLLDFCDVFVESPIQDIAKIMQEINLKWAYLMDSNRDQTKINIGYNYLKNALNKKMTNIILKQNIEPTIINVFYIMLLFRILPYTKSKFLTTLLLNEITKMLLQMRKSE